MIIGKLQTTLRSTHATRCILTLLTLATLGLAARAQQPAVASATAHRVATASAAAAAPKPGPVGEEAETPAANDAAHQGIHVHGHWVLQVKNPDGTLGERREFENSLVTTYYTYNGQYVSTSGAALLVAAMAGTIAMSDPSIGFVSGTLSGDPSRWCLGQFQGVPYISGITCYGFTTAVSVFYLNNPQGFSGATYGLVSQQLGANTSVSYTPTASMVISGNFAVPSGLTSISAVQTLLSGCVPAGNANESNYNAIFGTAAVRSADVSPKACTNSGPGGEAAVEAALTSTALTNSQGVASPLAVNPGSIVQVTVTISFS